MAALIQSLKILFLILSTGITIYQFTKSSKKGFMYYMLFIIVSGLFGFARAIYTEEILIPAILPISVYVFQKQRKEYSISIALLLILFYGIFITLITTNSSFSGYDIYFVYGLVLLIFANYLFSGVANSLKFYTLLWFIVLAKVLWLISYIGLDVFQPVSESRLIEFDTGLNTGADSLVKIDPNYLGFVSGIGFLLSIQFLIYREEISRYFKREFIQRKWFVVFILILSVLELWISVRGLSRGILLALIAASLVILLLNRKVKTFIVSTILLFVVYYVFYDLIELFILRFSEDNTGSGRYEMWEAIWKQLINEDRLLTGYGLNYPWWLAWDSNRTYASSHNSWISLLLTIGLIALTVLVVYIIRSISINYQANTAISKIRLVMLSYLIVACFSIEPLMSNIGWILFALSVTYDKKSYSKLIRNAESKTRY